MILLVRHFYRVRPNAAATTGSGEANLPTASVGRPESLRKLITPLDTASPLSSSFTSRYDGLDSISDHTYSYTTEWDTASTATVSSSFAEGDMPYLIADADLQTDLSVDVTFLDSATLTEGDTWTILISTCGASNPLAEGVSATLASEDGTAPVKQLTLDRGYEGTVPGSHDVYSVNQHFTVRASGKKEEFCPSLT